MVKKFQLNIGAKTRPVQSATRQNLPALVKSWQKIVVQKEAPVGENEVECENGSEMSTTDKTKTSWYQRS